MRAASFTRRRLFARTLAAPLFARSGGRPTVSAAVYVWTQHFSSRGIEPAAGLADAFATTRRAGYESVELMSSFFQPDLRAKTIATLRENGLALPSVYHGGPLHEAAGAEKTISDILALAVQVKPLGTRWINVNPSPKPKAEPKTDEELTVQAGSINRLASRLSDAGLRLQLHHHSPEMAAAAREWRHIAHNTEPALVSFCIDVHWVLRGGQDPMTILREAGPRLASLHLRNSRQGVWREDFGDGDIDYAAVADFLGRIRFGGALVVELAYEKGTSVTRSLEEDLRISRAYTRGIFGA